MSETHTSQADTQASDELEEALHKANSIYAACESLAEDRGIYSIKSGIWSSQRSGFMAMTGALCVFLLVLPHALLITGAFVSIFIFTMLIGIRIFSAGRALSRRFSVAPDKQSQNRTYDTLPSISILLPLYREAAVAAQSAKAMQQLDYPASNLEIIYLVEADDTPTIEALKAAIHDAPHICILPVPPSFPRTKPKALNYGLSFAKGDIVSVYDAEDVPHPDQLRAVINAFLDGSENLAVVQAPLHAYNGRDSWIASQFALEYLVHFDVWLPGLNSLGCPIALGGTSNHFKSNILREAGGWDPYNVTEDADLGFRLAIQGYQAGLIAQPTQEEAPVTLRQWLPQRTRWIKGHIQTWLVLMRSPMTQIKSLGFLPFLGLQLTFGGALLANFVHAPMLVWTLTQLCASHNAVSIAYFCLLLTGYLSAILSALAAKGDKTLGTVLTMPVYWPLMSLASLIAIWEMHSNPHRWSKTSHGVSPQAPENA